MVLTIVYKCPTCCGATLSFVNNYPIVVGGRVVGVFVTFHFNPLRLVQFRPVIVNRKQWWKLQGQIKTSKEQIYSFWTVELRIRKSKYGWLFGIVVNTSVIQEVLCSIPGYTVEILGSWMGSAQPCEDNRVANWLRSGEILLGKMKLKFTDNILLTTRSPALPYGCNCCCQF